MDRPLHLLIVDDRPDSVYLLSEFLLKRQHRVEVSSDGRESLAAVTRKRARGDAYDLVLANVRLKDVDGLALLRELRAQKDPTPVALIDAFADVDAITYREAECLGCLCFLDKPIDLQRVEQLLGQVRGTGAHAAPGTGAHAAPAQTDRVLHGSDQFQARPRTTTAFRPTTAPESGPFSGPHAQLPPEPPAPPRDEPFFGTARIARPPGAATERVARRATNAPGAPLTESFPPHPAPNANGVDPAKPRGELAPMDTARLRRGVTGSIRNPAANPQPPAQPGSGPGALERRVVCAACRKEFLVAYRDQEFTVNCVHCGQLNRVQPRAPR